MVEYIWWCVGCSVVLPQCHLSSKATLDLLGLLFWWFSGFNLPPLVQPKSVNPKKKKKTSSFPTFLYQLTNKTQETQLWSSTQTRSNRVTNKDEWNRRCDSSIWFKRNTEIEESLLWGFNTTASKYFDCKHTNPQYQSLQIVTTEKSCSVSTFLF